MPPPPSRKPFEFSATNKERNEYIPAFIAKKPFYAVDDTNSDSDYLEHQRLQKQEADSKWYDRGKSAGPAATKYRKGACENCGAMTHTKQDCLSRPRKAGARWTGRDIEADEAVQEVALGWDAKRDRWNGFAAPDIEQAVRDFNTREAEKPQSAQADRSKFDTAMDLSGRQSTARNLRLREDTAKYLLNLDLESAKYDPKSRSMVNKGATDDNTAALVAEEGFMRASGDAAEFEKMQRYAWESQERGDAVKLHMQANPTAGAFHQKKETEEAVAKKAAHRKALLDKYGGEEHFQTDAVKDAAVTESERYVEYDERGAIKGAPETTVRSRYPEDVFINNHKSVWGSWWTDGNWGHACCHSLVRNSYCTGEAGKQAFESAERLRTAAEIEEVPKQIAWKEDEALEKHVPNAVASDGGPANEVSKKRTIQEVLSGVTEEEVEEYKRKRMIVSDPMAAFMSRD